jgi:hypothetical protein
MNIEEMHGGNPLTGFRCLGDVDPSTGDMAVNFPFVKGEGSLTTLQRLPSLSSAPFRLVVGTVQPPLEDPSSASFPPPPQPPSQPSPPPSRPQSKHRRSSERQSRKKKSPEFEDIWAMVANLHRTVWSGSMLEWPSGLFNFDKITNKQRHSNACVPLCQIRWPFMVLFFALRFLEGLKKNKNKASNTDDSLPRFQKK